jgi:hypothetical protein
MDELEQKLNKLILVSRHLAKTFPAGIGDFVSNAGMS